MSTSTYAELGFANLLTDGDKNVKTAKSNDATDKYYTAIQMLAHAKTAGVGNVCASSSPGCRATCLDYSGHGFSERVKQVRVSRTKLWRLNPQRYYDILVKEIDKYKRKAEKHGKILALRLNGTSDIVWEKVAPWIFTKYHDVQFYDYTKHIKRAVKGYVLPKNYHLTFSRSEINEEHCKIVLAEKLWNVAVVFKNELPKKYLGRPVFNLDNTDLRFLDPYKGRVGGLYIKGGKDQESEGFFVE